LLVQLEGSEDIYPGSFNEVSVNSKASTYTGQYTTKEQGQAFVPRAGLEHAIPVFEQFKTMRTLHRVANVIG
jgi:hypothetical protein